MSMDKNKEIILIKYLDKYEPANKATANVTKTSEEIMMDLRPVVELEINDIADIMITNGYSIGFDGDTPVWLMKE